MEDIFEKYYDSVEKLIEESGEIKTAYDAKIVEAEKTLDELRKQESLMGIGSKLKEEKKEEIEEKSKEINNLKSERNEHNKYISDASENIRNQLKKAVENEMSKFKTNREMETAKGALDDKSNEIKEAQEKFENESKKVKELIAQKEALINERKKLDDLINNYGLYDNESTRNEIIEKIKSKQTEIETTAKTAVDFMDKGEELKSEKRKMEEEFSSYKPVSENVEDYKKLEGLSYRTMSQTSFKLEDVKAVLENWKGSKEEAEKDNNGEPEKVEEKDEEANETLKTKNSEPVKKDEVKEEKQEKQEEKPETEITEKAETKSEAKTAEKEKNDPEDKKQKMAETINENLRKKEEEENKNPTQPKEEKTTEEDAQEKNEIEQEDGKSKIEISAKDDAVYVNGVQIKNLGIASSINDKPQMYRRLNINKTIYSLMNDKGIFRKIFNRVIRGPLLKRKLDPTVINVLSRKDESTEKTDKTIADVVGMDVKRYITSVKYKTELPVDLKYDLTDSMLQAETDDQIQKYAKQANKIAGVEVLGLRTNNVVERLVEGMASLDDPDALTEADKIAIQQDEFVKQNKFRDELHFDPEEKESSENQEIDENQKEEQKTESRVDKLSRIAREMGEEKNQKGKNDGEER